MGALGVLFSALLVFGIRENYLFAIVIAVLLLIYLLIINNFKIGLFLVIISILFGQMLRWQIADYGASIIGTDTLVLLVSGTYLIKKIFKAESFPKIQLSPYFFLFAVWAVIALAYSLNFFPLAEVLKGSLYLLRWVGYLLFFYISIDFIHQEKDAKEVFNWVLAAGLGVAVLGFGQMLFVPDFSFMQSFGWDPHQGRLLSTFFDPNFAGGFLSLVLTIVLGLIFTSKDQKIQVSLSIAAAVLFVALVLTFSRSAYLGFLLGFLALAIIRSWKIALIGLAIIVVAFLLVPKSVDRVKSAWRLDESSSARIVSWQEGWQIVSKHPLVGIGFDNLALIKRSLGFADAGLSHSASGVDSSFLTLWTTTGVVGLAIYLLIYFKICFASFRLYLNKRAGSFYGGLGLGMVGALVGLLVESQFVNSWFYSPIMLSFFILAGLVYSQPKLEKTRAK